MIGVASVPGHPGAEEASHALQEALRASYGERATAVVLPPDPRGALPVLLDAASQAGAAAYALLDPLPRPADPTWLRAILDPVLSGAVDLVVPAYARGRFEGVLATGIVYPLTRALFGQRLRQLLGDEVVLSAKLGKELLRGDGLRAAGPAGEMLWALRIVATRDVPLAQVAVGPRPRPPAQTGDAAGALVRVLSVVFAEVERNAPRWMRVRGSKACSTFGDDSAAPDPAPPPAAAPLVSAFALGWQDLRPLWGAVLPPQTLLALQRIPRDPPDAFRLPDAVWARIVYDFAVAWRVKTMDRNQLLRSLAPLYLGWLASFVSEVAPLEPAAGEARVERLCAAFEEEKPYVISRWRWPDRFNP
jgi:hypothetical protein